MNPRRPENARISFMDWVELLCECELASQNLDGPYSASPSTSRDRLTTLGRAVFAATVVQNYLMDTCRSAVREAGRAREMEREEKFRENAVESYIEKTLVKNINLFVEKLYFAAFYGKIALVY